MWPAKNPFHRSFQDASIMLSNTILYDCDRTEAARKNLFSTLTKVDREGIQHLVKDIRTGAIPWSLDGDFLPVKYAHNHYGFIRNDSWN